MEYLKINASSPEDLAFQAVLAEINTLPPMRQPMEFISRLEQALEQERNNFELIDLPEPNILRLLHLVVWRIWELAGLILRNDVIIADAREGIIILNFIVRLVNFLNNINQQRANANQSPLVASAFINQFVPIWNNLYQKFRELPDFDFLAPGLIRIQ
jgi:hypothetical protein